MLAEDNYLQHLCPKACLDDPGSCGGDQEEASSVVTCKSQEVALSTGFTIASSGEAGGSIIAGLMYDHIGPLGTAFIGQCMHYGSWVMIGYSKESEGLWYGGMAINGLAVNLTAFPAFCLIDIFPDNKFLMTALIIGGQVSSTVVMPIIYAIKEATSSKFWDMYTIYMAAIAAPFSVMYLLALPISYRHLVSEYERKGLTMPEKSPPNWKVFFKCIITWESILFSFFYVLMIMQFNEWAVQLSEIAGDTVSGVVGWMMLAQGPLAVLLGWVNDTTKTIPICIVLTVMQLYAFGLIYMGDIGSYVAGVMFVISNAHIYTTKYNYAVELFPPEHFGKISGFFAFIAGALTFVNVAMDELDTDVDLVMFVYAILTILQFIALSYLLYRQFIKKITYITYGTIQNEVDLVSLIVSNEVLVSTNSTKELDYYYYESSSMDLNENHFITGVPVDVS